MQYEQHARHDAQPLLIRPMHRMERRAKRRPQNVACPHNANATEANAFASNSFSFFGICTML